MPLPVFSKIKELPSKADKTFAFDRSFFIAFQKKESEISAIPVCKTLEITENASSGERTDLPEGFDQLHLVVRKLI